MLICQVLDDLLLQGQVQSAFRWARHYVLHYEHYFCGIHAGGLVPRQTNW